MASGYLGKISAIVSANTGDFNAKLSASAKEVGRFAKTVESTLGAASRQAAANLANIYTPLQKFERALQAASTMKLSFSGFAGAIKNIDQLKTRLESIGDRQIDILLKSSGLKDISTFREALSGIRSKEFDLLVKVGGAEKLTEIRKQIAAGSGEFKVVADMRDAERQVVDLTQKIEAAKKAGTLVEVKVSTAAVRAAKAELKEYVAEIARAEGIRGKPTYERVSESLNAKLAQQVAFQASAQNRVATRDTLLAQVPESDTKARANIQSNYRGADEELKTRTAAVNETTAALAKLAVAEAAVASARAGRPTGDSPEYQQLKAQLTEATEKTKKLRAEAERKISLALGVDVSVEDIDKLLSDTSTRGEALEKIFAQIGVTGSKAYELIKAAASNLGEDDLKRTVEQARQMMSVSEQITKPISELAKRLGAASYEVQSGLSPAFKRLQTQAESLAAVVRKGITPGKDIAPYFAEVEARLKRTEAAINRVLEAEAKLGTLAKGNELQFAAPEISGPIGRAADLSQRASALPAEAIQANPQIAQSLQEQYALVTKLIAAYARLEDRRTLNLDTSRAEANVQRLLGRISGVQGGASGQIDAALADVERSARRTADIQATQRFVASDLLPFIDIGVVRARAVDAKELQAAATQIDVALADVERSARRTADIQATQRFVASDLLPFIDIGVVRARAVDESQRQREDAESQIAVPLEDLRRSAAGLPDAFRGVSLMSPLRQVNLLEGGINSMMSQLERLPLPIRQHFLPAIQAAEQEFIRLRALGPAATAEEIENAANNMRALGAAAGRATQGAAFADRLGGRNQQELNLNIQAQSLNGYQAQLQILMQTLGRVSQEARGPAVASFLQLQAAIQAAFENGTLDTQVVRDQIRALTADTVQATSRVANVGQRGLARQLERAGDVGRRGIDNYSLALNQAAYAVDDFLSSTGGIEFKLRAISNNVTQLAFILGGTTGLFIGLGAVIGGQLAVGLYKFINNGRTAEDTTKALNDALARQKSLAAELAQAYRSLGDALSRNTFSAGAEQAKSFTKQLDEARDKQQAIRRERLAGVDVGVQGERALQNARQKALEASSIPGERAGIQAEINLSRNRERGLTEQAVRRAGQSPNVEDIREALLEFGRRQTAIDQLRTEGTATPSREQQLIDRIAAELRPGDNFGNLSRLQDARGVLARQAQKTFLGFRTPDANNAAQTQQDIAGFIASIESSLESGISRSANNLIDASRRPALLLARAQSDVAAAIERGVPSAGEFQKRLDDLAEKLASAREKLDVLANFDQATAEQRTRVLGKETLTPQERKAELDKASAEVEAVNRQRAAVEEGSRAARLGRGFGGQRSEAALSGIQNSERFENERTSTTARLVAAIDAEKEARGRLSDAIASGNAAETAAARASVDLAAKLSDAAAAAVEFAQSLERSLERTRKIGQGALSASEQGADAAQRALTENPLRTGRLQARDEAEQQLIRDRARIGTSNNALDRARAEAAADPRLQALQAERERIKSEMKDAAAAAAQGGPAVDQAKEEAQRNRLVQIEAQEATVIQELTAARRRELDAIAAAINAREKELERSRQRDAEDPTFKRIRGQADQALADAEKRASEAQDRFFKNPTAENSQRRDEADRQLREQRGRQQELQDAADQRRRELENDPVIAANNARIQQIAAERARIAEQSAGRPLNAGENARLNGDVFNEGLIAEEARRRKQNEDRIAAGMKPIQDQIEADNRKQARRQQADSGRDLALTERERFRKDIEEGLGANIRARGAEIQAGGGDPAAYINKAIGESIKTVAPMLYEFDQERRNALLQGPSRARLDASDVSTTQGRAELNRLLRGEDSAKDVNLAELRKQTDQLQELIEVVKNNPLPVADFQ